MLLLPREHPSTLPAQQVLQLKPYYTNLNALLRIPVFGDIR